MNRYCKVISVVIILNILLTGCFSFSFWDGRRSEPEVEHGRILNSPHYIEPTNTYTPEVNQDGDIVIHIPKNLMSGNTPEEMLDSYHNASSNEIKKSTDRIKDIQICDNETVNFVFTPEQFEEYKRETYDTALFRYVNAGSVPSFIKDVYYEEIDEDGIPWSVVSLVDGEEYLGNYTVGVLLANIWPGHYLGQYQLYCGIPEDEWATHVTVKDAETGEILDERSYPIEYLTIPQSILADNPTLAFAKELGGIPVDAKPVLPDMTYVKPTNTYAPQPNKDGLMEVIMDKSLLSGYTAEEAVALFKADTSDNKGMSDMLVGPDGSAIYRFTPDEFEQYKQYLYDAAVFSTIMEDLPLSIRDTEYIHMYEDRIGTIPESIKKAVYANIDENGIPWRVVIAVDGALYEQDYAVSALYATVLPAVYLGRYQIFCGIPADEWQVDITVQDEQTGAVLEVNTFPDR